MNNQKKKNETFNDRRGSNKLDILDLRMTKG